MYRIFLHIMALSISASILALIAIAAHFISKNRLSRNLMFVLWGAVFIKLLVPLSVSSPVSIFNATGYKNAESIINNYTSPVKPNEDGLQNFETILPGGLYSPESPSTPDDGYLEKTSGTNLTPLRNTGANIPDVVSYVWFGGMITMFSAFFSLYIFTLKRFKSAEKIENKFIDDFIKSTKTKRKIDVFLSSEIDSPVVIGWLKPRIVFPADFDFENEKALSYVLIHEIQHIKHFDNLIGFFALTAACIHWFNPIVWLGRLLLSRDIEYACDERVLNMLGQDQKSAYAASILDYAIQTRLSPIRFVSGFGQTKLIERVKRIMNFKKITVSTVVSTAIVAVSVLGVFATGGLNDREIKKVLDTNKAAQDTSASEQPVTPGISADFKETIDLLAKAQPTGGNILSDPSAETKTETGTTEAASLTQTGESEAFNNTVPPPKNNDFVSDTQNTNFYPVTRPSDCQAVSTVPVTVPVTVPGTSVSNEPVIHYSDQNGTQVGNLYVTYGIANIYANEKDAKNPDKLVKLDAAINILSYDYTQLPKSIQVSLEIDNGTTRFKQKLDMISYGPTSRMFVFVKDSSSVYMPEGEPVTLYITLTFLGEKHIIICKVTPDAFFGEVLPYTTSYIDY